MSYIPGAGLKKPLNQLEAPIAPDIRKAPPRFVWSRKHWKVDTGKTMAQVEHIPQMQEDAVLFQNRDYNSQFAYGKFSAHTQKVNKEFRPPLIDRDDLLPLSRIPRPVIIPRINPGGAFASGGSVFSQQNNSMPQVEKFLTDRVKAGEVRPTFFAPISMPEDNSILPDLETKLPPTSASAGFKFTFAPDVQAQNAHLKDNVLEYNQNQVSATAGYGLPFNVLGTDSMNHNTVQELEYSRPQVSASAGYRANTLDGLTPVDFDLQYSRPQVSASAGYTTRTTDGLTPVDFDLQYSRPQVSASAGYNTISIYDSQSTNADIEKAYHSKLDEAATGGIATATMAPIYNFEEREMQHSMMPITDEMNISYVVPSNTFYQTPNSIDGSSDGPFYREKQAAISGNVGHFSTQGHIRRPGLDRPQVRLRRRK